MEFKKWNLEIPEETNGWSVVVEELCFDICTIYNGQLRDENNNIIIGKISDESKKIGLLISKAPEMLGMLKSLLNEPSDIVHSEIKKDIEKLIKKATELTE
jgi:chemotaxis signal transduction protein